MWHNGGSDDADELTRKQAENAAAADDDEDSSLADDEASGACCSECGVYFAKPHGWPVLCENCWSNASEDERDEFREATNEELQP